MVNVTIGPGLKKKSAAHGGDEDDDDAPSKRQRIERRSYGHKDKADMYRPSKRTDAQWSR